LGNGIPRGTHAIARDITERRRLELLERDRLTALEMIATRKPLEQILAQLSQMVERQYPGVIAAVSLLRNDRLYTAAASAPPDGVLRGIKGMAIGPTAGAAGAAAYRRETVISGDIASDPVWEGPRELALKHGLASCWSVPILAGNGQALGVFSIYQERKGRPDKAQLAL